MIASRLSLGFAVGLTVLAGAAGADAATVVSRPVAISGASPFTRCGDPSETIPGAEVEPSLAVNPRNPRQLMAAWQQDRRRDTGASDDLVGVSSDGGTRWRQVVVPGISRCAGGENQLGSDPWLSFGPDGTAYFSALTLNPGPEPSGGIAVGVARDGGRRWSTTLVDRDVQNPLSPEGDDKEAVTADPRHPGTAYLVWIKFVNPAAPTADTTFFSRTTDGGRSWSPAAPIQFAAPGSLILNNQILVLHDGTLLDVFTEPPLNVAAMRYGLSRPPGAPASPIYSMRSSDGGRSWSEPVKVGAIPAAVVHDPDTGAIVRSSDIFVAPAAIAPDETVYVGWQAVYSNRSAAIQLASSADGGRSWSAPRTVAAVPAQAFLPAVAAGPGGSVAVLFDDFRKHRAGARRLDTDVWIELSSNGGRAWRELHVAGSFDMRDAPASDGLMLGDFQQLVAMPGGFGAVFVQARPAAREGPTDVFFAGLSPKACRSAAAAQRAPASRTRAPRRAPSRRRRGSCP